MKKTPFAPAAIVAAAAFPSLSFTRFSGHGPEPIAGTGADQNFCVPGAEANRTTLPGKAGGVVSPKYVF